MAQIMHVVYNVYVNVNVKCAQFYPIMSRS